MEYEMPGLKLRLWQSVVVSLSKLVLVNLLNVFFPNTHLSIIIYQWWGTCGSCEHVIYTVCIKIFVTQNGTQHHI